SAFNTRMGLISDDVNCLFIDHKENLWVGGSKGISVMNVLKAPRKTHAPKLHIEQLNVNGKKQPLNTLTNSYEYDATVHIAFKAITYTYPEKLQYQYRFNDNEWINTNDLKLTFSALQPNDYTFQVRAKKFNSDWTEPLSITFQVLPPWWFSWWAIVGYMVLIGSGSAFIIQLKNQKQKRIQAERIRINKSFAELELKALQAQMNPHFIFNALNSIQSFILDNNERLANKYLTRFSKLMRLSLEASKSKYILIGQEVKLLNSYMELEELRFGGKFKYTLLVDPEINQATFKVPGMIIQPFVENAIHHGLIYREDQGDLMVEFIRKNDNVLCVVDDNGIGRKKASEIQQKMGKTHKSRATQIIDERLNAIERIGGVEISIKITDKENQQGMAKGTRVEICFPVLHEPA
ncbi:MAG: histidine kinase, partial [Flammeovirgaceae bacterium]